MAKGLININYKNNKKRENIMKKFTLTETMYEQLYNGIQELMGKNITFTPMILQEKFNHFPLFLWGGSVASTPIFVNQKKLSLFFGEKGVTTVKELASTCANQDLLFVGYLSRFCDIKSTASRLVLFENVCTFSELIEEEKGFFYKTFRDKISDLYKNKCK
jgi:hypothetical protein